MMTFIIIYFLTITVLFLFIIFIITLKMSL